MSPEALKDTGKCAAVAVKLCEEEMDGGTETRKHHVSHEQNTTFQTMLSLSDSTTDQIQTGSLVGGFGEIQLEGLKTTDFLLQQNSDVRIIQQQHDFAFTFKQPSCFLLQISRSGLQRCKLVSVIPRRCFVFSCNWIVGRPETRFGSTSN